MSLNDVFKAIDAEIALIEKARKLLTGYAGSKGGGKSTGTQPKAKRTMSAAARKRIAEAQRKRWAAVKRAKK